MKRLFNLVRKVPIWAYAVLMLGVLPALAAGVFTNGLPPVFPAGTTGNQTNLNGINIGVGYATLPLTGNELIGADTQLSSGQNPQSEAVSVAQLKLFSNPLSTAPASATVNSVAGVVTLNASLAELYTMTLTGPTILGTPSNLVAGKQWKVFVQQDGTGSRTLKYATGLYTWPCTSITSPVTAAQCSNGAAPGNAPVVSATASAVDLYQFIYDGTKIRGTYNFNFN